jgi:hypothetical protein
VVFVDLLRTNRPFLSRFSLIFLGLGLAVFAWGLQYKLSLYDPPHSVAHQMPEAKLLSKDEHISAPDGQFVDQFKAKILPALLCSLFVFFLRIFDPKIGPAWSYHERERKQPWRVFSSANLDAFFFRPPPILPV